MIDSKKIAALATAAVMVAPTAVMAAPTPEAGTGTEAGAEQKTDERIVDFALVDKDNKKLDAKDGIFEILDKDGKVVATFDFSKPEAKRFSGKVGEKYTAKVKTAPKGWETIQETKDITIISDKGNQQFDFPMAEGVKVENGLVVEMTLDGKPVTEGTVTVIERDAKEPTAVLDFSKPGDKTCKVQAGKTYILIAKGPAGYVAENSPRRVTVKDDNQVITEKFNLVKEVKKDLNLSHIDADTQEPLKGGKVEIVEKDTTEVLSTIDFAKDGKGTANLVAGKTYTVRFVEQMEGYKSEYETYEVKMEAGEGAQEFVVKSRNVSKPEVNAIRRLNLRHLDQDTREEIKQGVVSVVEVGADGAEVVKPSNPSEVSGKEEASKPEETGKTEETAKPEETVKPEETGKTEEAAKPEANGPKASTEEAYNPSEDEQQYHFMKDAAANNINVEVGKTYKIKFISNADGYKPVQDEVTMTVNPSATDGADDFVFEVYSTKEKAAALPKTGVVATSGAALAALIGSGFEIIRRMHK